MKVSICIPTYNQGQYLEGTLKSVLSQTVQPFEVIVSNDCSTDNTNELLDYYSRRNSHIKVVNQPVNLGMNKNTDACLRLAVGDMVVKLDSDDLLLPHYVAKLLKVLETHPKAGYAHASVQEINEKGISIKKRNLSRNKVYVNANDALKAAVSGYRVAANIIMFRRETLEKVNYIQSKVNFGEDYYLSAAIAAAGYGNVYINDVLSCYRVWSDAGQVRQKRKLDEINGLIQVYESVLEPAFIKLSWDIGYIKRGRSSKAIAQMNCLGWEIYSMEEKIVLKSALYYLSSSNKVKIIAWLYLNKFGFIPDSYSKSFSAVKIVVKKLLFLIKSK